ncbi:peptide MFS transporter [Streptomyces sp. TBY4]|uniref:peptide MFS transporter n=1 Tax=Streptomyces sp. TBY4 TaxID=2962030 RepID=UPI00265E3363|nr:oligopeptide:H+ symporter [Streptomyces sp. TBY4]
MRAVLALFLIDGSNGLGMSKTTAVGLVGAYLSACYLTALPGGWIADRLIGARRAALAGGCAILAGHIVLALEAGTAGVYAGLVLIAVGTGLQKPNMTAMVGTLYTDHTDQERDSAYSRFYASVNAGGLVATLLVGWLGLRFGWSVAFGAAVVAMAFSLVVFWFSGSLRETGNRPGRPLSPAEAHSVAVRVVWTIAGVLVVGPGLWTAGLLTLPHVLTAFAVLTVIVPTVCIGRLLRRRDLDERGRAGLRAYAGLFAAAVAFFCILDLAGSSVQLFAADHVDMMGLPVTWQAALNPVMTIAFAGVLAAVWRRVKVSAPAKFSTGLVLGGMSFLLLALAASRATGSVHVSLLWLVGLYVLLSAGELILAPTGLSISHKLAPAGTGSQLVGLFFLAVAAGDAIGSQVATHLTGAVLYVALGGFAVVAGLAMTAATPKLRLLTGD